MAQPKTTKTKKKRAYNIDPLAKIKNGKPWTYHFEIEEDVAVKIIEENETTGAEYGKIILNRLRKSYGIKKGKKIAAAA
jgi:hypothetical protein